MARSTKSIECNVAATMMANIAVGSPWVTICGAGEAAEQDNGGTITVPLTDIREGKHLFGRNLRGTLVALSLGYDDGLTAPTEPVVILFGRYGATDRWARLPNRNGVFEVTLSMDVTNDVSDGTLQYTDVDPYAQVFDVSGCDQFIVGVATALAGTGTTNTSILQARIYG